MFLFSCGILWVSSMMPKMIVLEVRCFLLYLTTFMTLSFAEYNRYVIDDRNGLGRSFDGIGGISGGGATSKLLISYPEPQRSEILDYLFKPNFGASLHILKVEIGGDGQSTDGSEASHMHYSWDENYQRGYEWWLMVEAKKRNPDIRIYGLPWSFPGWLNPDKQRNPFQYPVKTSGYIIKWIHGAKTHYNITVDFIGIWNENKYDKTYIKIWNERGYDRDYVVTLRKELDKAKLQHVKIVAPDAPHARDWKICPDMLKDKELSDAIEAVGCHYPGTNTTQDAIKTGKPLWASEDYSTTNDLVGGGCWARLLNQNFVNGNITGTISWNLIAAYYETLPYSRDGLMSAESPWSGNYVVNSPIWMSAHTTQFTQIGWKYYRHGKGSGHLQLGGSYVTLTSPDHTDFTMVIETMSHNHSKCSRPFLPEYTIKTQSAVFTINGEFSHDHSMCIRPFLPEYDVLKQDATFTIKGKFASITQLYMWKSSFNFVGDASSLFIQQTPIQVKNGSFTLTLDVDEVVTLSTVSTAQRGSHPTPPKNFDFPLPYDTGFENDAVFSEPPNFAQQTGSFEVIHVGGDYGNVMRQMVTERPIYWCSAEKLDMAINVIGTAHWLNIYITVDVRLAEVNGSDGYFVAGRVSQGGCHVYEATGVFFFVYPKTKKFIVSGDFAQSSILKEGNIESIDATAWNNLTLLVKDGVAAGAINANYIFNISTPKIKPHGFAGLGTTSWGKVDFDNVHLSKPFAEEEIPTPEINTNSDQTLRFEKLRRKLKMRKMEQSLSKMRMVEFKTPWSRTKGYMSLFGGHKK